MKRKNIKYFRTESNYKKNNLYLDKINQFSYSLFKINDENRKKFLNNKEILLDAVITNYTNANNIRFSKRFNDDNKKNNYNLKSMNNSFNNFLKDSKNKSTKNSSMGFNIFSKNNKELFPELNNKDNKENKMEINFSSYSISDNSHNSIVNPKFKENLKIGEKKEENNKK